MAQGRLTKRQKAANYRKAAKLLETGKIGWCQNVFFEYYGPNERGAYCAIGALNRVDGDKLATAGFSTPSRSASAERFILGTYLPILNDKADNLKDVVRAMRKVARALEHGAPD